MCYFSANNNGWDSLVAQLVKNPPAKKKKKKNPPAMQMTWIPSLGWEDSPGGGHGNLLQYSCLENPHGKRSLTGYSPWSCQELDMTEPLSTAQGTKIPHA